MATILVTAIGSFAGDIIIKNLKRGGHTIIGCDIYPANWVADSRNVDRFVQAPTSSPGEPYVNFLVELCKAQAIGYIMPLTDPEVDILSGQRALFKNEGITICTSDPSVVSLCRDKYTLPKYLEAKGITNTIPTALLSAHGHWQQDNGPCIAKPRNGRSSQGCFTINNQLDYEYIRAKHGSGNDYVMQPHLKGHIVTVDLVRDPASGRVVCIARRELLRTTTGAGTTVEVLHAAALERLCQEIATILGIAGVVNLEFIEDGSEAWRLLEINPRFSAGVEFSCMAGYDMVIGHLNCFQELPIPALGMVRRLTVARKYDEVIMQETRV